MMKLNRKRVRTIYILLIVVFTTGLGIHLTYFLNRLKKDEQKGIAIAEKGIQKASQQFGKRLSELMAITEDLADKIDKGQLDSSEIIKYLETTLIKNPDVFGFGVGYEPFEFNKERKLFGPFYIRPNDKIKLEFIEDSYDYTTREWYTRPLNNGKAWFEPPYFGVVAQTMMAEYSVPFYKTDSLGNKVPIGIVFIDYSLKDITKSVNALDLGKSGYGFMFSEEGIVVAHPDGDKIQAKFTIDDFSRKWQNEDIKRLFIDLTIDGKSYLELVNPENGSASRMFFEEIKESGWRLGALFVEDAFKTDGTFIRRSIMRMLTLLLFILLWIHLLILYNSHNSVKVGRYTAISISVYLLAGMLLIWYTNMKQNYNIFQQEQSFPITDKTSLDKFISDQDSLRRYYHQSDISYIPTGVFIKQIEFDGAHNIKLSGVIWQHYLKKYDSMKIEPGVFFFGNAPDAETQSLREIYRKKEKDKTIIGWYFRMEIRENMDYSLYPFDRERVKLYLGHPNMHKNIQLIPDFSSYNSTIPTQMPGVEKKMVLPEWMNKQSYFDFKERQFNTNFGVLSGVDNDYKYDLCFNIVLERKLFWPFLSNMIPLITVASLLYMAIFSILKRTGDDKKDRKLFNGFGLLELNTAFLFVAILTHIDLRSSMSLNYLIYMDYFYFHIYLVILSLSIVGVLSSPEVRARRLERVKYLYWPLLHGSFYFFTFILFY